MAREPELRIVMNDGDFELERIDPLEPMRAKILAQQAAVDSEIADAAEEALTEDRDHKETSRLSITERLVILGLRKASKDELRRIILVAMAGDLAA